MKRLVVLLAALALIPAAQAKKSHLTVTLAPAGASYVVTVAGEKPNQAYSLWVAQICPAVSEYHPVVWGDNQDPSPTVGTAGPFDVAAGCTAYVWLFPDAWTPISNEVNT